jgi:hypothetical protein
MVAVRARDSVALRVGWSRARAAVPGLIGMGLADPAVGAAAVALRPKACAVAIEPPVCDLEAGRTG